MKLESKFLGYIKRHPWVIGGFTAIILVGIILNWFTHWAVGDTIAILAVLSSMFIMMYNGHRTEYRFQKLIEESDKNTLRRIIGPERRKELMIFGEDLEVLYYKSHEDQLPIELIAEKLKRNDDVNDAFLKDFFNFLKYTAEKVTTHNLSSPLKILIYNDFIKIAKNVDESEDELDSAEKLAVKELANRIYNQVVSELNDQKNEF